MINIPEEIYNALPNNKLVIFVGSGFSKPLGFYDWNELAIEAIKEYSKTYPTAKLLLDCLNKKLLSEILIFDALRELDKNKIIEIIKSHYNKDVLYDKLINHEKLWKISNRIITTNYDKAIEIVKPTQSIEIISHNHLYELGKSLKKESWLLHIHGMIDNTNECLIFSENYHKLYHNNHPAIEQLKSIAINNTILFIGFSMKDKYVSKLFENLNLIFGETISSEHFILLEESEQINNIHLKRINLPSFNSIPGFLDQLIELKESQIQSPIPVKRFLRSRCRTFEPGSDEFNLIMVELRNGPSGNSSNIKFNERISKLKGYENVIALAVYREKHGEIENMIKLLEGECYLGNQEMTRLFYLSLAFEKLDWIVKAMQYLDKILACPTITYEMSLCAKFNRSICAEKIERYDEVYFEQFITNDKVLRFTNERIKDKAISNHLIVCKKRKIEFLYEPELMEVLEYESNFLNDGYSKTLINYLACKNGAVSNQQYLNFLNTSQNMDFSARIASICTLFKLLDKESMKLLKNETFYQIEKICIESKSKVHRKHLEDLKKFIGD